MVEITVNSTFHCLNMGVFTLGVAIEFFVFRVFIRFVVCVPILSCAAHLFA